MKRLSGMLLAAAMLGSAPRADAQTVPGNVQVHGFTTWTYGATDGNRFLEGVQGGQHGLGEVALNIAVTTSDRLRFSIQPVWEFLEHEEGAEIDYAFAEWSLSSATQLRVGQVKQPFGIYTEVFDVGTLRPFTYLPQSVYGASGTVAEAYSGIGITGALDRGRWRLAYDLYGGGLEAPENAVRQFFLPQSASGAGSHELKNVIGGRLTVTTPLQALDVGVSAYRGVLEDATDSSFVVGAVHAQYLTERWSLRSEAVQSKRTDEGTSVGWYAEAGRRFGTHWQAALLYDWQRERLPGVDVSAAPSLLEHRAWATGLNYWFSESFVLKLSYHVVEGNRFAGPSDETLPDVVAAGGLEPKTKLVLFGAQFSF